jgi:two-component system, chemotaxis family, chemotaxis protein CheY
MAQAQQVDVLVVDDDEAIRTMLRRSLQRVGLVVAEARDGVDALERLQTIDCAVILLDLMMPRLDGHGFIEQFVASRQKDQHPIIFAVSASGDEELARARADVVHAVVRKPFDMNELAEIVALCVSLRWAMPLLRNTRV